MSLTILKHWQERHFLASLSWGPSEFEPAHFSLPWKSQKMLKDAPLNAMATAVKEAQFISTVWRVGDRKFVKRAENYSEQSESRCNFLHFLIQTLLSTTAIICQRNSSSSTMLTRLHLDAICVHLIDRVA